MDGLERKIFTLLENIRCDGIGDLDVKAEYDEKVAKVVARLIREKFIPKEQDDGRRSK